MKLTQKLIFAFLILVFLMGLVGFFGLIASKQIVESFEGGEEHFRSVAVAATEVSSYVKRAEGHLILFLTLNDEADKKKFFERYKSLREQILILDERARLPEARKILDKIKSEAEELLAVGESLIEVHDKDIANTGGFEPGNHGGLIRRLNGVGSAVRKNGVKLTDIVTEFLNKQESITSATEVSSYVKKAEGHLMLFLTLNDEADKKKFFERYKSLREQILILDERARLPEARKILDEIKSEAGELLAVGESLIEVHDKDIANTGGFEPGNHGGLIRRLNDVGSAVRKNGVKLAKLFIDWEVGKKAKAIKNATSIQRNILIVMFMAITVALIIGHVMSRAITRPIAKLKNAALEIGEGKLDAVIEVESRDEIGVLANAFNKMTEALQKTTVSRDYMDNVLKSMHDSLVVTTPEGRIRTVNRATIGLLGYTEEELIGEPAGMIFTEPECFEGVELDYLIERGFVSNAERTYLSTDGRRIPVLFSASVMRGAEGAVRGIVCVAQDITERKQMLDALRESREKLNAMLHSITDQMSMIDKKLNVVWANESAKRFFGEDVVGKKCYEVFHGAEKPCKPYPCFAQKVFEDGKGREYEHRFTARDGEIIFFHCTANVALRGRHGEPIAVLEVFRDITASKLAEERLRLTSKVFENTVESIVITDAEEKIVQVNEAFTSTTGYGPEEAIGETPRILKSDWHDEKFYKDMWKSINDTGTWHGEVWNRRKDGEIFAALLTINAIKDEAGGVANYVGLIYDITEKKRTEERIEHLAYYDALTNLPNRSLFYDRLEHTVASSRRYGRPVALMFLDLDNFKTINDTLGHHMGDLLLKSAAGRLTKSMRKDSTVSRIGGDEFTVILPNIRKPRDAVNVAERIIEVLSRPFTLDGHEVFVSVSIGISLYPEDADNADILIMNADTAMYHAKEEGGGSYQFFSKVMNVKAKERLRLGTQLRHALEKDEFVVYYQPLVDLKTGRIIGLEALVRWYQPEHGLIPPAEFIPAAEETGLVTQIDEWVLRTACTQTRAWHEAGFDSLRLAVNFSGLHLRHEKFVETVCGVLNETGLDPPYLEMEITEGVLMEKAEEAVKMLNKLKSLGVKLSVDDFGTGYSSLNYLKRFPIDKIKIDHSFVRDILTDADDATIVKTIISLAHNLNHKVVAEGVETEEQMGFLLKNGCDEMQGYFFSRPLPPEEFVKLLQEGKNVYRKPSPEMHGPDTPF